MPVVKRYVDVTNLELTVIRGLGDPNHPSWCREIDETDDPHFNLKSDNCEIYRYDDTGWYQNVGPCQEIGCSDPDGAECRIFAGTDDVSAEDYEVRVVCRAHTDATYNWNDL